MIHERRCTGPLRLGVPDEFVATLEEDERVVWLGGTPVLVPIEHLPWWSGRFFGSSGLPGTSDVRYCDWDALTRLDPGHGSTDGARADDLPGGLWVCEVPDDQLDQADRAVAALASQAGRSARAVPLLDDEEAVEEYYATMLRVEHHLDRPFDLRASWRELVDAGAAREADPDGPSLMFPGHPVALDELWQMYADTMGVLSLDHPIEAVLQREEFDGFVTSERDAMLVLCSGGAPISVALVSSDPNRFEWLDQRWIDALRTPPAPREVAFVPGIATRIDSRMKGSILELLTSFTRLIVQWSTDITVVFPCNNLSRNYTPRISQRASEQLGDRLRGRVHKVAGYVHRGYVVEPGRGQPEPGAAGQGSE